jgi:hypothetical protein
VWSVVHSIQYHYLEDLGPVTCATGPLDRCVGDPWDSVYLPDDKP